mmetsp:Transcript_63632/g.74541  ORF Transcript_63632/g.74541 Transcript_63632/m.74541 type:complete len:122 (-) Transcript_63632:906-1271(-)
MFFRKCASSIITVRNTYDTDPDLRVSSCKILVTQSASVSFFFLNLFFAFPFAALVSSDAERERNYAMSRARNIYQKEKEWIVDCSLTRIDSLAYLLDLGYTRETMVISLCSSLLEHSQRRG